MSITPQLSTKIKDYRIGEAASKELKTFLSDNPTALCVFEELETDEHIQTLLEHTNTVAIGRLWYNDHGLTHSRITALNAVRILHYLYTGGVVPNILGEHIGKYEDAQLAIVVAAYLHDIGITVHRSLHFHHTVILIKDTLDELISRYYKDDLRKMVKLKASILEYIYTHDESVHCTSVEGGCVKVGDGTDMAKGRARLPFSRGKLDIHSASALAIDSVAIEKGAEKPVCIKVDMSGSAGIFQVQNVLGAKINTSGIKDWIEIIGTIRERARKPTITKIEI